MALITSKYAGKCGKCAGWYAAGEQIEWEKGKPATHARCAAPRGTEPIDGPRPPPQNGNGQKKYRLVCISSDLLDVALRRGARELTELERRTLISDLVMGVEVAVKLDVKEDGT